MDKTIHGVFDFYRAQFEDGYFFDSSRNTRDEISIFIVWLLVVLGLALISYIMKKNNISIGRKLPNILVFIWTFCASIYFPFGMIPASPDANLWPTIIFGTLICLLISFVVSKLVSKINK